MCVYGLVFEVDKNFKDEIVLFKFKASYCHFFRFLYMLIFLASCF